MTAFLFLRLVAQVRRLARAREEANALAQERLAQEFPEWGRRAGLRARSKLVEIGRADVSDFNKGWRRSQGLPEEE